jgi:hypothetical protein
MNTPEHELRGSYIDRVMQRYPAEAVMKRLMQVTNFQMRELCKGEEISTEAINAMYPDWDIRCANISESVWMLMDGKKYTDNWTHRTLAVAARHKPADGPMPANVQKGELEIAYELRAEVQRLLIKDELMGEPF